MENKIQILKNSAWIDLFLGGTDSVKYNILSNKIGNIAERKISHSNTFSLPYVSQNISALDLNVFNPREMAKALNKKYVAKYYVGEKLLQTGYLVINNTETGVINVNFIDEALSIVDKWGSMTYKELLKSNDPNIPTEYQDRISECVSYAFPIDSILAPLSDISGQTYKLAMFPNNLNAVGDKYQIRADDAITGAGTRLLTGHNPYQDRPIWNVKAFIDIAIRTFGYTPIYGDTIDWARIERTYMIEERLDSSSNSDSPYTLNISTPQDSTAPSSYPSGGSNTTYRFLVDTTASTSKRIIDIPEMADFRFNTAGQVDYRNYWEIDTWIQQLYQFNFDKGTITWRFKTIGEVSSYSIISFWEDPLNFGTPKTKLHTVFFIPPVDDGTYLNHEIYLPREGILPPAGAGQFLGIGATFTKVDDGVPPLVDLGVYEGLFREEYLSIETIHYDENEQFYSEFTDLTYSAPNYSIKELMSSILHKEGILITFRDIGGVKTATLFSYGSYLLKYQAGNYARFSDYFLDFSVPFFNTDYGSEYAKINEVGLKSPFPGNTAKITLTTQGEDSKYKDFTQNLSKKFKDIESVILVAATPSYFEYKNTGLGLVEYSGDNFGTLTQYRADGTEQGDFTGLPKIYNVNGLNISSGITEWYNLVDSAVRCIAKFLLPEEVIKNFKIEEPIYVEQLGGFYIVEEIEEYQDSITPVNIKLIKLLI